MKTVGSFFERRKLDLPEKVQAILCMTEHLRMNNVDINVYHVKSLVSWIQSTTNFERIFTDFKINRDYKFGQMVIKFKISPTDWQSYQNNKLNNSKDIKAEFENFLTTLQEKNRFITTVRTSSKQSKNETENININIDNNQALQPNQQKNKELNKELKKEFMSKEQVDSLQSLHN